MAIEFNHTMHFFGSENAINVLEDCIQDQGFKADQAYGPRFVMQDFSAHEAMRLMKIYQEHEGDIRAWCHLPAPYPVMGKDVLTFINKDKVMSGTKEEGKMSLAQFFALLSKPTSLILQMSDIENSPWMFFEKEEKISLKKTQIKSNLWKLTASHWSRRHEPASCGALDAIEPHHLNEITVLHNFYTDMDYEANYYLKLPGQKSANVPSFGTRCPYLDEDQNPYQHYSDFQEARYLMRAGLEADMVEGMFSRSLEEMRHDYLDLLIKKRAFLKQKRANPQTDTQPSLKEEELDDEIPF